MGETKRDKREILKQLRLKRAKVIDQVRDLVKKQRRTIEAIEKALEDGPKTVPEISELTAIPGHEVLWWIASLKKYGVVAEGEKQGSYFTYRLTKDVERLGSKEE